MTTAIILAGGLGTRLREAVPDVPKPLAPIAGRPFLAHQIDYWMTQGVTRFILSVGYRGELIQAYFGRSWQGAEIVYVTEDKPLGTGGGVLLAMEAMADSAGPFLIANGDTFFDIDLAEFLRRHRAASAELSLALRRVENNTRYGEVVLDGDGRVLAFRSTAEMPGEGIINGGIYLAERSAFAGLGFAAGDKASLEQDLFLRMLGAGRRLCGFAFDGRFIDIGIPEDYRRAATVLGVEEIL